VNKSSKLKRRLRKKFHIGEFQELGFEIFVKFKSELSELTFDAFLDDFIGEIEKNKLLFGGGSDVNTLEGFVTASQKYQSPTDLQIGNIKNWLKTRTEISEGEVGKLKDAWYN
jgi:uncharacterized protein YggL (DUF469 family)